ncbi:hypothetical protein [Metabacillus fastidiosus]
MKKPQSNRQAEKITLLFFLLADTNTAIQTISIPLNEKALALNTEGL